MRCCVMRFVGCSLPFVALVRKFAFVVVCRDCVGACSCLRYVVRWCCWLCLVCGCCVVFVVYCGRLYVLVVDVVVVCCLLIVVSRCVL